MSKQEVIYGSMKNKITSSDLLQERSNIDFDISKENPYRAILDQNNQKSQAFNWEMMKNDPVLQNSHKFYEMTKEEMWMDHMKKLRRAYELHNDIVFVNYKHHDNLWAYWLLGQNMSVLNQTMFLLSLENMCDEEQYQKWVTLCRNFKIMGCYAQTELGHGSDVSSLETTAVFDQNTDEFIINTPNIKAAKFWPGDLGNFSTHAIVFAKMIIDGNPYGVLPFIVQLRDTQTFMPMKGIKCGDIGPKMGYHSKNNGWCTFDNVRIPRNQMLMKYTKLDKDGCFSIDGDTRALYSVMMHIRMLMISHSGNYLLRASLIAVRYSVIRRQFKNTSGSKEETKLLDYQTQQLKLFPQMSLGFAFMLVNEKVKDKYNQLLQDVKKGKFDLLDEMHHLTSGMKALYTQLCFDGLLIIRQSVGGAGYSAWSGLPYLIEDFSACVTYEGDNTVMFQQCARFLQKLYKRAKKGKTQPPTGMYSYLNQIEELLKIKCNAKVSSDFENIEIIEEALKVCTAHQVDSTMIKISKTNATKKEVTNHILAIDIVHMAEVHMKFITFVLFNQKIQDFKCQKLKAHFTNMCCLIGLHFLKQIQTNGYDTGYFKQGDQILVDEAYKNILKKLRPYAIPLIELHNIPDYINVSSIGNSYGDIYETQFEWAQTSRMNDPENGSIPKGFNEYILPILQGKL